MSRLALRLLWFAAFCPGILTTVDQSSHNFNVSPTPEGVYVPSESTTAGEDDLDGKKSSGGDGSFLHAFVASMSMVIVSELGDKTFFIAAIMSMKYSRIVVFTGAMSALLLMTVLSALFGYAVHIIPRVYIVYFSAALFFLFGVKMLYSAYYMSDNAATEEMEEAQAEIQKREAKASASRSSAVDLESGAPLASNKESDSSATVLVKILSGVFAEAFLLTFFAEWGDRSQITTVVLAARESIHGVIVGGSLGHSMCTGLAVLGGRLVSQRISVKNVTFLGGAVFFMFGLATIIMESTSNR